MSLRRVLSRLLGDSRGVALVEFAMIAPVLVVTLLGAFEMGYNFYIQTQLQGSVQRAARTSTIESAGSSQAVIDAAVDKAVRAVVSNAQIDFARRSYTSFSDVSQPEDFRDVNSDGRCDDGEQFEDVNGNGDWDADRGRSGFGGARDVVLYEVTVTYPRTFGVVQLLGFSRTAEFKAITVLRNQPWDSQETDVALGTCV